MWGASLLASGTEPLKLQNGLLLLPLPLGPLLVHGPDQLLLLLREMLQEEPLLLHHVWQRPRIGAAQVLRVPGLVLSLRIQKFKRGV